MGVLAMGLHPTAHDMLEAADGGHAQRMNVIVHGVALASVPVLLVGLIGLTSRLAPSRLATAGLVTFGLAGVAVTIAAVASGSVATDLVGELAGLDGAAVAERDLLHRLLGYTHAWNQAFARVYVVASCAAVLLWSLAILSGGRLSRAAGVAGLAVGAGVPLLVHLRHAHLDVHGFGTVVLLQSAWYVWVAVLLMRAAPPRSTGGRPA
jgi:hypothetical protein